MNHAPVSPRPHWRAWTFRVLAVWALMIVILLTRALDGIAALAFSDPDDALRLLQVRSLLDGQAWYDLVQHRVNPPEGVVMHWSRLVDLPIAATISLLAPLFGTPFAESAAAVIVPLLTLLAALLLTGRMAARLGGLHAAFLAPLMWLIAFPARNQINPLRFDHHGWQIVAVLAALNGLTARSARAGGWLVGVSLGLGMAISLELLPFTVMFAGIFALRWIAGERGWLTHMTQAFALTSILAFAATRGPDWANYCDAVSPFYIAGFTLAAVLTGLLARLPRLPALVELGLLGLAVLAGGGLFLALAPHCATGPFAQLDPMVRELWLNNVLEGRPVWMQDPEVFVQMIIPPLFGLGCAVHLWRSSPAETARIWLELTLLLAGALVIAALVARFSAVAVALAAVPIGCVIRPLVQRIEAIRSLPAKVLALAGVILALIPGIGVLMTYSVLPSLRPASSAADAAMAEQPYPRCGLPVSLESLKVESGAVVFAPVDMAPDILMRTPASVVATGHHRASAAIKDVFTAFTAAPAQAESIIRHHGADYVVLCDEIGETGIYRSRAPQGFSASLADGKVPGWLEPVKLPEEARTLKLWKVRR